MAGAANGPAGERPGGVIAQSQCRSQKFADLSGDLIRMGLQCEVTRIEEAHRGIWDVALECVGARGKKERIVLAPYREQGRLVLSEVLLKGWVHRYVGCVVSK